MTTTQAPPTLDERLAGHAGAAPPPPPMRRLPTGRRRLPGPSAAQLVAVELAGLVFLLAFGRAPGLTVLVGVLAAGTVLLLFARRRSRWWYEHVVLRLAFRRWNRRVRPVPDPDPRRAGLRELAPRLAVADATERGSTFGVAHDGTGWYAVVEVLAPVGQPVPLPLRQLADLVDGTGQVSRLQVVLHDAPAPVARLITWAPAAASYRDVSAKLVGPVPPGESRSWLVVRLDRADALAAADSRGGGVAGVRRALAAALGRVGRVLSGVELAYRLLDADEVLDALAGSLGLGAGPAPGTARTAHQWDRWSADGYAQVCFQVVDWPPHAARLTAMLGSLPAAWTSLSMVLGPRTGRIAGTEIPLRCLLRVAAAPDAIGAVCEALHAAAELQVVGLRRLDGEHGPAAYATAPTGGGT